MPSLFEFIAQADRPLTRAEAAALLACIALCVAVPYVADGVRALLRRKS